MIVINSSGVEARQLVIGYRSTMFDEHELSYKLTSL